VNIVIADYKQTSSSIQLFENPWNIIGILSNMAEQVSLEDSLS